MTIAQETFDNFEEKTIVSGDNENLTRLEISHKTVNKFDIANILETLDCDEENQQVKISSQTQVSFVTSIKKSTALSSSSSSGVNVSGRAFLSPRQQEYFAPRLSTDSISDGGYCSSNDGKRSTSNYEQGVKQRLSSTWSRDSEQPDSDSASNVSATLTEPQPPQHWRFAKAEPGDCEEGDGDDELETTKKEITFDNDNMKKWLYISNYKQRSPQSSYNKWSLDSRRFSNGSSSSTESGIFSGADHNHQPPLPEKKYECKIVQKKCNDRKCRSNFPVNIANDRFYDKTPPGRPIPTSGTHFASSKSFNALAASALPQPPQHWLLRKPEQLSFKVVEDIDERELARKANTFDYYNLKMLLTVGA
nr:uncharacterized protein LOC118683193 [Bactrocera oleae]